MGGTYSVTHVRNSEIFQLLPLFFAMLWDIIDFIFGMWVYNDKLRFVPVQWFVGRVVTLGLWNLAQYLVVTTFCDMLVDIDLIFGIWVYNDELQIKFHSGPMIFGRAMARRLWNLAKYLVVSPLYFTMIWYIDLIFWYACIIISYRSTLKCVPVEWFFANLQSLGFEIWPHMSPLFFTMIWDFDLIFGMWVYWWVTDQVLISFRLNDFGLIYAPWTINFGQIFSCHHALRYCLDFWYLEL